MSDNRPRQRWTLTDTHGRPAAGHVCCGAGSLRRNLASGRRGQRSGSRSSSQHNPRPSASVCCMSAALPNSAVFDQGGAASSAAGAPATGRRVGTRARHGRAHAGRTPSDRPGSSSCGRYRARPSFSALDCPARGHRMSDRRTRSAKPTIDLATARTGRAPTKKRLNAGSISVPERRAAGTSGRLNATATGLEPC